MQNLSAAQPINRLPAKESLLIFQEEGSLRLGPVMPPKLADQLRAIVEERYAFAVGPGAAEPDILRGDVSLMRMFEVHRIFRQVLAQRDTLDLVEEILGSDCHVIAQNALRTPPGRGIVNWHIDDALYFPFIADQASFLGKDIPCFALNVMIALTDVLTVADGPTQVVRGSHLSGKRPEYSADLPSHHAATSVCCRRGEAYLMNSQTWHRGAQNTSERTRYLLTTTYGRRFISQRFYPFLNYHVSQEIRADSSGDVLRLLGQDKKGPYG
jgi:Phytanoyl-CoA dioxygenase (PhyH)